MRKENETNRRRRLCLLVAAALVLTMAGCVPKGGGGDAAPVQGAQLPQLGDAPLTPEEPAEDGITQNGSEAEQLPAGSWGDLVTESGISAEPQPGSKETVAPEDGDGSLPGGSGIVQPPDGGQTVTIPTGGRPEVVLPVETTPVEPAGTASGGDLSSYETLPASRGDMG